MKECGLTLCVRGKRESIDVTYKSFIQTGNLYPKIPADNSTLILAAALINLLCIEKLF